MSKTVSPLREKFNEVRRFSATVLREGNAHHHMEELAVKILDLERHYRSVPNARDVIPYYEHEMRLVRKRAMLH